MFSEVELFNICAST